jgi:hypothetical protein
MAGMLDMLPQESFDQVRAARNAPGADQSRLAIEDRRAFAREFTRERPVLGPLAIAILAPLEQVAKGVAAPFIPALNAMRPDAPISRSGFANPVENVGGAYAGVLQGLNDRGLFGK